MNEFFDILNKNPSKAFYGYIILYINFILVLIMLKKLLMLKLYLNF